MSSLLLQVICGGSYRSDDLVTKVEALCKELRQSANNLEHLHLPVASNKVLMEVSHMAKLTRLHADRTKVETDFQMSLNETIS